MRLYSFIRNEKGSSVQKGGNKGLDITIYTETEVGDWIYSGSFNQVGLGVRWNEGKPFIVINFTKNWKVSTTPAGHIRLDKTN